MIVSISAEVSAEISAGRLVSLKLLKHGHGRGIGAESLIDKILDEQSLDVDIVTGATASSKAILKAVESALEKGKKNR